FRAVRACALVVLGASDAAVVVAASGSFLRTRGSLVGRALDTSMVGTSRGFGGACRGNFVVAGHTHTRAAEGAVVAIRGTSDISVFDFIARDADIRSTTGGLAGADAVLVADAPNGSGGATFV